VVAVGRGLQFAEGASAVAGAQSDAQPLPKSGIEPRAA